MAAAPLLSRGVPMTSVPELYALQGLDLALAAARAALADVHTRLEEPEELATAREAEKERQEAARVAEHQFKEREFEADELRRKTEPIEQRLYQGGVRNPKELEDLQLDLDSLKRRRSELEDQALEAMDALEQAQQALSDAQRELQQLTEAREAEVIELHDKQASLEREIETVDEDRSRQAARIDEKLLGLYDRLSTSRQGRAVAKVEGGACQGCRISLPINLVQRARGGGEPVQCSSCERILYVR